MSSAFGKDWLKSEQAKASGAPAAASSGNWKFWEKTADIESGAPGASAEETSPLFSNPFGAAQQGMFSRAERLKGFVVLMLLSVVFFLVAFFIGLPMILFSPGKFGLSFTIGSLLFMMAFAMLEGFGQFFKRNCSWDRAPFTSAYFISMGATLYACVLAKSYIMTVCFSGLQILALLYYAFSQVPGGASGLKFLTKMVFTAAMKSIGPCLSMCGSCLGRR